MERDLREAAESNGKKLRGLGGIIPWGSDVACQPFCDFGIHSLQGIDLSLNANKRRLDAALSILIFRSWLQVLRIDKVL